MRQTNLSFSRKGVIRGLHYHERGQDDLFVCLQGMVRVVVLDRETGETFTEDIGDENPVAIYVPGIHAHGFEALTDALFCYLVTEEYDAADPDEHGVPWNDPRVVDLWSTRSPMLSNGTRTRRPDHRRRRASSATRSPSCSGRARRRPAPSGTSRCPAPSSCRVVDSELVLHAAAWTNVDGAEDDPQGAAAVNVGGTQHVAELGAPLVDFSTDYVFDGTQARRRTSSRTRRTRSAPTAGRSSTARRPRASGRGSSAPRGSSARPGHNFVRTMLRLGAERDEVSVVDDQRGCPTYVGHLAAAMPASSSSCRSASTTSPPSGDCTWADFAEAIFEEAGLDCRVRRITTEEFGATGPAAGVLGAALREGRAASCRTGARACASASRAFSI